MATPPCGKGPTEVLLFSGAVRSGAYDRSTSRTSWTAAGSSLGDGCGDGGVGAGVAGADGDAVGDCDAVGDGDAVGEGDAEGEDEAVGLGAGVWDGGVSAGEGRTEGGAVVATGAVVGTGVAIGVGAAVTTGEGRIGTAEGRVDGDGSAIAEPGAPKQPAASRQTRRDVMPRTKLTSEGWTVTIRYVGKRGSDVRRTSQPDAGR